MIKRRSSRGVSIPFGTDPAFGTALHGDVGYAYGEHGPAELGPVDMIVEVGGERRRVVIPDDVQWACYEPVTQRVQDAAEDAAGRPSKLGEVLARDLHARGSAARAVARRDVLEQIDGWAAAHRVQIVIDIEQEGLSDDEVDKALHTARVAALNGLAGVVARALSLPGLAARAARLERLVGCAERGEPNAVDELVGAVRALLDGVPRPLTEDDLDDVEHQALERHRRRVRDIMRDEARQTVSVIGWEDVDGAHFDLLLDAQQAEALSHCARLRYLPAPKERGSSPASG